MTFVEAARSSLSSRVVLAAATATAFGLMVSRVNAQIAPPPPAPATPNCTSNTVGPVLNLNTLAAPSSAVASSLAGAIGNINTIFLTQQGSAFVSAPPNPAPNQPGGGAWVRAVGGEATLKSTSSSTGTFTVPANPPANSTATTNCNNSQANNFYGVQVGQDIARLNWNGWNMHVGATAGYVSSDSRDNLAGFSTRVEVPFAGGYVVATRDRFFADVMLRQEFYNMRLNDPALGFFNQPTGARGISVAASAGYNVPLANNWFVEPSGGVIWSKTRVDNFTSGGTVNPGIAGINSVDDITSTIGRLSLRGGTTISSGNMIWQPFASVSVFHEFAGPVTSRYVSYNAVQTPLGGGPPFNPATYVQTTSTSRVGTYGQYSLGIAGQVANTGWLGFARLDYRNGNAIDGWTGNAGIRYQFTPETIAAAFPVKAPVKARGPVLGPVSWTGFYVGGFFGADYGTTDVRFPGAANDGAKIWAFGPIGGGQAGYNYQVNQWVFGVEGEIGAAAIKGSRTCGTGTGIDPVTHFLIPGAFSPASFACTAKSDWVATATARVGYAYERTLYYVKGGAAFTESSISAGCVTNAPGGNPPCNNVAGVAVNGFGTSARRTGWTIGYGAEFDLGKNWSARAEYDYIDFGRKTNVAGDGTLISDHPTTSQAKIGLNYRFAPGVVVAKY